MLSQITSEAFWRESNFKASLLKLEVKYLNDSGIKKNPAPNCCLYETFKVQNIKLRVCHRTNLAAHDATFHIKSFWDKKCCDLAIQLSVAGQRVNFRCLVCTCDNLWYQLHWVAKKKQTEWKLRHHWNLLVPLTSWMTSFSQGPMQLDRRAQILTVPFLSHRWAFAMLNPRGFDYDTVVAQKYQLSGSQWFHHPISHP